jgi:hypothetical protein
MPSSVEDSQTTAKVQRKVPPPQPEEDTLKIISKEVVDN